MHISTLIGQTFRDLLQPGEHLCQFLLPLSQLTSTREVYSEQSHDGVDDLKRTDKRETERLRKSGKTICFLECISVVQCTFP